MIFLDQRVRAIIVHYVLFFVLYVVSGGTSGSGTTTIVVVEGRQWQSIIDHTIVRKSDIDSSRYELKIETDPFFDPEEVAIKSPTNIPTESSVVDSTTQVWTTLTPTHSPSAMPSDGPSLQPTMWNIEQNGGCRFGLALYQVHMYDTWGDGWGDIGLSIEGFKDKDPSAADLPMNSMTTTSVNTQGDTVVAIHKTIELDSMYSGSSSGGTVMSNNNHLNPNNEINPLGKVMEAKLERGSHDYTDVCLVPNRCYKVKVTNGIDGGEFLDEISWDIRPVREATETIDDDLSFIPNTMEPILKGGAPSECTFSLPDEYGNYFCPNQCADNLAVVSPGNNPDVMANMAFNEDGAASETLTEAVGRKELIPSGSLNGKTQTSAIVTESMLKRSGTSTSSSSSSILSRFNYVESDEHSNT